MDPMTQEACQQAGINFKDKLGSKQLEIVAPNLRQLYAQQVCSSPFTIIVHSLLYGFS
jgi:hypothetical protein